MAEITEILQERVAELDERLEALSTRLGKPKKRGFLDILTSFSTLISGVLIAAVGTTATVIYNEREMQISHLDAVDKYRRYVASEKPADRRYGYKMLKRLGEAEFAIGLIADSNDSAGLETLLDYAKAAPESDKPKMAGAVILDQIAQDATEEIMVAAKLPEKRDIQVLAAATTDTGTERWVYLGHYLSSEKKWKTRYFSFAENADPNGFEGKPLEVRKQTGDLNVRTSMPSSSGQFGDVIGVLKPGSKATIEDVQEWRSTGYMWARITYGT